MKDKLPCRVGQANLASGTRSSTVTKIIIPAAKDKKIGINFVSCVASISPKTANIGSTTPDSTPMKNAFLLPTSFLSGKLTAMPSGMFCSAMPTDKISAENIAAFVPAISAPPNAKPTINPSGMLCKVMAIKNEVWFLVNFSHGVLDLKINGQILSITTNKSAPKIRPPATGRKLSLPKCAVCSIAGKSKPKMQAENIIPPAKPSMHELSFSPKSRFKKNTNALPNVVAKNMLEMPKMDNKMLNIVISYYAFLFLRVKNGQFNVAELININ